MSKKKSVAKCPQCGEGLDYEQAKSIWGAATSAQRKTIAGGRPVSKERCPCGKFTAIRAVKRGHWSGKLEDKCNI